MPAQQAAQPSQAQKLAAAKQANQFARDLINSQAIQMETPLAPVTLSSTINNAGQIVNILPRNVGLVKGFYVEYSCVISNGNASAAITPTELATLNLFSNIQLTDFQNNVRINCPGYQIGLLDSIKQRNPFATALVGGSAVMDNPTGYGANTSGTVQSVANTNMIWQAPASIAHATTGVLTGFLWIPCAYSDHDFRGAIYAAVINGQMNLQFQINSNPFYLSGGDQMLAMYGTSDSASACTILSTTISVTQVYMDQLTVDPKSGLPILPQRDISTIYELKNTTFTAAVPNNDFPMQYPNFRDIVSSIVLLDNLGAPVSIGSFINYFALQAANSTNIFKRDPAVANAYVRNYMGFDLPKGIGYFSYRNKPLSTTQYGNLQLMLNGNSNWSVNNAIYHCWESFASIATITQAGSLSAS